MCKSNHDLFQPLGGRDSWVFELQALQLPESDASDVPAHIFCDLHTVRTGTELVCPSLKNKRGK